MTTRVPSPFRWMTRLLPGVVLSLWLAACGTAPVARTGTPLPFEQAIEVAADNLAGQMQKNAGLLGRLNKRAAVLDPTLDASSGQQTAATQQLDRALAARLTRDGGSLEVLPFESANLAKAPLLLTGTLTRTQGNFLLNLALVDIRAGEVLGQSSAVVRKEGVDMNPLPYYRDSPVLMKDKVVDGYVRTSATPAGQKADAAYLERIAAATVINDATTLYNAARYREALGQYRSALATPAGDQIRALNGVYISAVKLGLTAEAEEAFGRLVAYGIAYNSLGMKFLFNPGSTEFWSDPKVSGAYGMWLRQIARQAGATRVCMDIVGHTSATGSEAANDSLSLRRAAYIKQRLNAESPEVARRTRTQGMGARQNIVGTGTDDVVDAPDRRVEFAIVECAK